MSLVLALKRKQRMKGASSFCYSHQTRCHKEAQWVSVYLRSVPHIHPAVATVRTRPTQQPLGDTFARWCKCTLRAQGHTRESRHTLLHWAPMEDCGECVGTYLAVGGSWCMKWPSNVTARERERGRGIMVSKARKEDISNFCWTNWAASFHGTLTATYSHTPFHPKNN